MNNKHKKTLNLIFENPVRSKINREHIENLFIGLGAEIKEIKCSRVSIFLNENVAIFHRPHPEKETDKGVVKSVREFLRRNGVQPC